ncbi:MAG: hypothetical protein IIC08_02900 [Proteobacteria bacterium]|nr:hypothetical protein [Pseudomonadota bacterium]
MQLVFKASRFVTEATIMGTTTVILDGLRSRLSTWFDDPSEAIGSLTGEIRVSGGDCSMRIMMGDDEPGNPIVPLSVDFVQPDTYFWQPDRRSDQVAQYGRCGRSAPRRRLISR